MDRNPKTFHKECTFSISDYFPGKYNTNYFHASIAGVCQIFNIAEIRFLTLPMGLIVMTFSIIVYPSIFYQKTWLAETWIPCSFFVGALYPFVLLIIGWIRFRPAKIKKVIKST